MLREFLSRVERELACKDPDITGVELVNPDDARGRLHLTVSVRGPGSGEIRLPVTISLQNVQAENLPLVAGIILQTVDLGTWGTGERGDRRCTLPVTA